MLLAAAFQGPALAVSWDDAPSSAATLLDRAREERAVAPVAALGESIPDCRKAGGLLACPATSGILRLLDSIMIADGRIVPGAAAAGAPADGVRLSEELADVPLSARVEFVANLLFQRGKLVSAYTGGLESCMSEERLARLLDRLARSSPRASSEGGGWRGRKRAAGALGLCGDGWCEGVVCVGQSCEATTRAFRCYSGCGQS